MSQPSLGRDFLQPRYNRLPDITIMFYLHLHRRETIQLRGVPQEIPDEAPLGSSSIQKRWREEIKLQFVLTELIR